MDSGVLKTVRWQTDPGATVDVGGVIQQQLDYTAMSPLAGHVQSRHTVLQYNNNNQLSRTNTRFLSLTETASANAGSSIHTKTLFLFRFNRPQSETRAVRTLSDHSQCLSVAGFLKQLSHNSKSDP